MDEFGETPSIFVWPSDHAEGEPFPKEFWDKLNTALASAGIAYERA